MSASVLRQEKSILNIDFREKRLFVCGKNGVFMHVANTRDPDIREVSIRDCERGLLFVVQLSNNDIPSYASRFGMGESAQWWSQDNPGWAYQDELDERAVEMSEYVKSNASGRVYFIFNPARNAVKIGYTRSVDRRFRNLQTASPDKLELLGYIKGNRSAEAEFHERFAIHKSNGEWFEYVDEVKSAIADLLNVDIDA